MQSVKTKMCRACFTIQAPFLYGQRKSINSFKSTYGRHKYQNVREHARRMAVFYKLDKICSNCGYDKHVELCHLKAISSFPSDTLLSIVNSKENLSYLCPNCHWEQENLKG